MAGRGNITKPLLYLICAVYLFKDISCLNPVKIVGHISFLVNNVNKRSSIIAGHSTLAAKLLVDIGDCFLA